MIVKGIIAARMIIVKTMMLNPKLSKKMEYNSTRLLIIGATIAKFQMSPIRSNGYYPLPSPAPRAAALCANASKPLPISVAWSPPLHS